MFKKLSLILLSLLLLTGCMELPEEEQDAIALIPPSAVYTEPSTEPITTTAEPLPNQEEYSLKRLYYLHNYEMGNDELGDYYYFSQYGQKTMELELRQRWQNNAEQSGVLLFVDGYPQPYNISNSDHLSYLHPATVGYSDEKVTLKFTPVRGIQGDMPEFVWFNINEPDSSPETLSEAVNCHTSGAEGSTRRILMCATPEPLPVVSSAYPLPCIKTFEPMNNNGDVDWTFTVNGENNIFLDGITASTPLDIEVECWGMDGAKFTIVVFVDNEPVRDIWDVSLIGGQKTILNGTLLLDDFDGSAVIYAVLVPRNTTDPKFNYVSFYPMASQTYYLTD